MFWATLVWRIFFVTHSSQKVIVTQEELKETAHGVACDDLWREMLSLNFPTNFLWSILCSGCLIVTEIIMFPFSILSSKVPLYIFYGKMIIRSFVSTQTGNKFTTFQWMMCSYQKYFKANGRFSKHFMGVIYDRKFNYSMQTKNYLLLLYNTQ